MEEKEPKFVIKRLKENNLKGRRIVEKKREVAKTKAAKQKKTKMP